jgi:hypothetical protein
MKCLYSSEDGTDKFFNEIVPKVHKMHVEGIQLFKWSTDKRTPIWTK